MDRSPAAQRSYLLLRQTKHCAHALARGGGLEPGRGGPSSPIGASKSSPLAPPSCPPAVCVHPAVRATFPQQGTPFRLPSLPFPHAPQRETTLIRGARRLLQTRRRVIYETSSAAAALNAPAKKRKDTHARAVSSAIAYERGKLAPRVSCISLPHTPRLGSRRELQLLYLTFRLSKEG